jgi:hypothetical protein
MLQTPQELWKVFSDSASAFSEAHESTWSYRGSFRMLRELMIRIVEFWNCCNLWAGLWETSRAAETSAQVCTPSLAQLRPWHQLCGRPDAISSHQWFLEFHKHMAFPQSYSSLWLLQDLLHHTMAWILQISLYIYIWRYRDKGDGDSDKKDLFGRPQGRETTSYYMKYTLYLSQLLVSCTPDELS